MILLVILWRHEWQKHVGGYCASVSHSWARVYVDVYLNLRLLMSYIYGAPSKARNANVVYIWTYVW